MDRPATAASPSGHPSSLFELAPPRHFILPAILLLLLEAPAHGYSLVKELRALRLGRVDRPSVYRALAQLEADELVDSWSEAAKSGQPRRVYGLTPFGERSLRAWMGVIKEERDGLDRVLRRYAATGTIDAMLAGVESGWAVVTGLGSSVSPTSESDHHREPTSWPPAAPAPPVPVEVVGGDDPEPRRGGGGTGRTLGRFEVVGERSAVLIEARSTVGPITFGAIGVRGVVETEVDDGVIRVGRESTAHLEIEVSGLASGNALYDAELLRRIDARRYPVVTLDLKDCSTVGAPDRLRLAGEVTVHGVTRALEGTVEFSFSADGRLVVTGEQVFDIRDFGIASPTVLMLRIYPDVVVRLHVEAELTD